MNNKSNEIEQLTILQILAYHLLPGIPILMIAIFLSHPAFGIGFPIFLAVLLGILFGLIPVQLGIITVYGKRQGKRMLEVLSFLEHTPRGTMVVLVVGVLVFCILTFSILAPIEHPLWTVFSWVPDWFRLNRFVIGNHSDQLKLWMLILGFGLNGIAGPLVEEFYFRGFLLPRMGRLGAAAPFVNAALFSLYHFFTPWENVTRIIALTPMVYTVWFKKNIRISILVHCILNTSSVIIMALSANL